MNELNVALVMSLKDKLLTPLQREVQSVEREFNKLEKGAKSTEQSSAKAAESLAKIGQTATAINKAAQALEQIGAHADQAERKLSLLERTTARLKATITGLGSAVKTGFNGLQNGVAGIKAFDMVAADPLRRAADYDMSLRHLVNTAYAGQPLDVRRGKIRGINDAITGAVRFGGGSRESAMEALNSLIASGQFGNDPAEAAKMLPLLTRAATAGDTSTTDMAAIAIRAKSIMGIDSKDLPTLLDRALVAGQQGGFELKDMAHWLPRQMANASELGMKGLSGATAILAANQAAVMTAGSPDEAGNNLADLLHDILSPYTGRHFKVKGVDYGASMTKAIAGGMNTLDAFVGIVDKVASSDPRFVAAQKALAGASTDSEKHDALQMQASLLRGFGIGSVAHNQQSLSALLALMNNRDYVRNVEKAMLGGSGAIADNASLIQEGPGYTFAQRQFEEQNAQTQALTEANGALQKLAQAEIDLYQQHPGFAQALEGSKIAVEGFTAALLASGLVNLARGAGAAATAEAAAAAAGTGTAATEGAIAAATGAPGAVVGVGGAAASLYAAGVVANNLDSFRPVYQNGMESAMSGDTGFAAAILDAANSSKEAAQAAKDAASRPVQVYIGDQQVIDAVHRGFDRDARRQ